jgi:hypothetical protein
VPLVEGECQDDDDGGAASGKEIRSNYENGESCGTVVVRFLHGPTVVRTPKVLLLFEMCGKVVSICCSLYQEVSRYFSKNSSRLSHPSMKHIVCVFF